MTFSIQEDISDYSQVALEFSRRIVMISLFLGHNKLELHLDENVGLSPKLA